MVNVRLKSTKNLKKGVWGFSFFFCIYIFFFFFVSVFLFVWFLLLFFFVFCFCLFCCCCFFVLFLFVCLFFLNYFLGLNLLIHVIKNVVRIAECSLGSRREAFLSQNISTCMCSFTFNPAFHQNSKVFSYNLALPLIYWSSL